MKRAEILFLMMAAMTPAIFRPVLADQNCVSRAPRGTVGCTDSCIPCPYHGCCKKKCGCGEEPPNKEAPPPRDEPPSKDAPPPGGPPTAFVAPPPTGTVEGPSTGWDLGGVSLTFPELTLKLPRLRFQGASRLHQHGRMHLNSAIAPLAQQTGMGMGMPGGMPAMAVPFTGFPNVNKDAPPPPDDKDAPPPQPPDDTPSKSGKPPCGKRPCTDAAALRSRSSTAPSENIDELEVALRAQVGEIESIMRRIQQLREQQSVTAPVSREVDPIPMPQYDADSAGRLRPFPPAPEPVVADELRPAFYQAPVVRPRPIGAAPQLQRLPPVRR